MLVFVTVMTAAGGWGVDQQLSYLHDGVGGQDLLLDIGFTGRATDRGEVPHGILSRDSLSSSRLPTDND